MTSILLTGDARNPGEYLAICGLLELLCRVDRTATAGWTRRAGLVPEVRVAAADVCEIDANIDEPKLANEVARALGTRQAWRAVTSRGRVPLPDAVGTWCAGLELVLPGQHELVVVDHWYERAFVSAGQILQRHGKRDGKGRWKFWAGQQDSNKGITGLVLDLVDAAAGIGGARRFQDLLAFASPDSSRLNLDAAATRSSIDRGISANDAAASGGPTGRPALELLAAIGMAAFFPPRRYGDSAPDGTLGVTKRTFRYCTWNPHLPLSIARLSARGVDVAAVNRTVHEAVIAMMGQYSYLKLARPAGIAQMSAAGAAPNEEEEENSND